jgi:hypothetical protein
MLQRISQRFLAAIALSAAVGSLLSPAATMAAPALDTSPLPSTHAPFFAASNPFQPKPAKPASINDVPITDIFVLSPTVKANVRALYAAGVKKGNNPAAFSALGDSTIAGGLFLERFSDQKVKLGDFAYLQPALIAFRDSLTRTSASIRIGLHSWTALNPVWADKKRCEPAENGIDCELRLNKPSVMFIHLGANDTANKVFDKNMRKIVEHVMAAGVVPVLITKAEPPDSDTRANNDSMRAIATTYNVPLIDFDKLAGTLPNYGLGEDKVHMTNFGKVDYTQPALFKNGHAMHNLTALIALDAIWRAATTIE